MMTEGTQMTMLDTRQRPGLTRAYSWDRVGYWHGRAVPVSVRPTRGALPYRGTGVRVSRAPHRPRPVSVTMTVTLAGIAALIALWLVMLGQSRVDTASHVPDQLAVVQVQPGENLQRLASRVAPDAPVGTVVDRIRQLNELDSSALDVGQTLIAPVG
jgi:LysM domain